MALKEFASAFSMLVWPWYMPSVDEYRGLAEASGLNEVKIWGESADRFFADEKAMIAWLDQPSLVPLLAHLPGEKKSPFRAFVVQRMIEETKQTDGRCFETFRHINLSARK